VHHRVMGAWLIQRVICGLCIHHLSAAHPAAARTSGLAWRPAGHR
jgi:hypothetical protein